MQPPSPSTVYQQKTGRHNDCLGAEQLADLATWNENMDVCDKRKGTNQKTLGNERDRGSHRACAFHIRTRDGSKQRYGTEAVLATAEQHAKQMRTHVTMPDVTSTHACVPPSFRSLCASSGVRSCFFECIFDFNAQRTSHENRVQHDYLVHDVAVAGGCLGQSCCALSGCS